MEELQEQGVTENIFTISCSCSPVPLWMKSAWIIAGNSAVKSYSIQEVLEAAQASQHFRSCFLFVVFLSLFSLFVSWGGGIPFVVSFFFSLWFVFWQTSVRASWTSMKCFGMLNPHSCQPPPVLQRGAQGVCQPSSRQQQHQQERWKITSISVSLALSPQLCCCCCQCFSPDFIFPTVLWKGRETTSLPHRGCCED